LEQRGWTHSPRVVERLDSHERRPPRGRRLATTGACRAARREGEEGSARAARGPRSSRTAAMTTTTHIGHDLLPMESNTASCRRLRTCGRGGASVHGCRQYQSIARRGRWRSSFLSGHKTTASYWPLPALQNVSKRLSSSTSCTEVGSFLGEVPYRAVPEQNSLFHSIRHLGATFL